MVTRDQWEAWKERNALWWEPLVVLLCLLVLAVFGWSVFTAIVGLGAAIFH